tara:strand:- start:2875 stop:3291 length:417 start_codon:yes stop_codon:yes gene_type:complete
MTINKKIEKIIFPQIKDKRGKLTICEYGDHIKHKIKRIYYLEKIPSSQSRGFHAHKTLEQTFIAISGSFSIRLDDGSEFLEFKLSNSHEGLYVSSGLWREIYDFSKNAICLVLASDIYDEDDYIRDYNDFIKYKNDTL